MDKTLFKAYVREMVKEMLQEEVERILPKLLDNAINEIKSTNKPAPAPTKPPLDRTRLAELMGLDAPRMDGAAPATFAPLPSDIPEHTPPEVKAALTRNYSELMKAMKIT